MAEVANAWRGETVVCVGEGSVKLRCQMETYAKLIELMKVETLVEVHKKWDGLNPYIMRESFFLLAEDPAEARAKWPQVHGLDGLKKLHVAFFEVTSGQTPDQIREAQDVRKKLEAALQAASNETVMQVIEVLQMIEKTNKQG